VARAKAYLLAKFHLDPSNRLATIYQRYRQTDRTGQRSDGIGRAVLQTVVQKRFAYATGPLSVLSVLCICLSVTLVYCGHTVGWIKTKLSMEVCLGPAGHIVLDGDPALPQKWHSTPPHFTAHVYCGKTVSHVGNC